MLAISHSGNGIKRKVYSFWGDKFNNHNKLVMALKRFLDSYQQVMPKTHKNWIASLSKHPKLFIYHPITAHTTPIGIAIKSQHSIPAYTNVLMLSTSESFTSKELVGASIKESNEVKSAF